MKKLRGKDGCPWDRKQTLETLRRCLLEEAYEVLEAINENQNQKIEEELGDLLIVISMMMNIAEENKQFSKGSVLTRAMGKMISRHPHVFGDKKAETPEEALNHWNSAKMEERKNDGSDKKILSDLKTHYPALMLAYKVQKRVSKVGFDWDSSEKVIEKVEEELEELKLELVAKNVNAIKEEMGDFLFSAVNLARKIGVDPELALNDAITKFRKRFSAVEESVHKSKKPWTDYSLEQLEEFWQQSK